MTIKYRQARYGFKAVQIEAHDVIKETEKSVVIRTPAHGGAHGHASACDVREYKTGHNQFYDTWEKARAALVLDRQKAIQRLEEQLEDARTKYAAALDMEDPTI